MNQQQAREIVDRALQRWASDDEDKRLSTDVICDALHAAFEAEREQHKNLLDDTGLTLGNIKSVNESLRLASIKATARRYAANGYGVDSSFAFAEKFEDAFERRYGGAK